MIVFSVHPETIHTGQPTDVSLLIYNKGFATCADIRFTLETPSSVLRLRGQQRIHVERLDRGKQSEHQMRLRADQEGSYSLLVTSLSYRGPDGEIVHPGDRILTLQVIAAPVFVPSTANTPTRESNELVQEEIRSLHRQLEAYQKNLLMVEERKTQHVDPRNVPPDLEENERRLEAQIARIRARLESLNPK